MPKTTLLELQDLSIKVEGWVNRYDIHKSFYEDLYEAQLSIQGHLEAHQDTYNSSSECDAMLCINSFILVCLLGRINEINENDIKA